MSELLIHKCPCCNGAIEFDSSLQKLKCPYCDTEFDIETLSSYNDEISESSEDNANWDFSEKNTWSDDELSNIKEYSCNSCGGEIICDNNTAATSCPFCDNPVIMKNKISGAFKPDFVIPFRIDKEMAKAALNTHLQGKRLLPKVFKDENHIDEIKGVYVPFWLFNCNSSGNAKYRATRIRTWRDSNYIYTETSYYLASRNGSARFERVPVDGATSIRNDLMESIEPYNFEEMVDFNTAFLSGYFADKYDVGSDTTSQRANERIKTSTSQALRNTVVGYNSVTEQSFNYELSNNEVKYALLPVWFLNTTWNDEKYTFVMNGQTGRFAGDLPLDKKAYHKWLWSLTGIIGAIGTIATLLFWFL